MRDPPVFFNKNLENKFFFHHKLISYKTQSRLINKTGNRMNYPEKQKTVLVTGAAKRIGRKIALTLAQSGFNLAIHYSSSKAEAQTLCEEARTIGVKAEIFCCDFADPLAVKDFIPQVIGVFPDLFGLINNASIFEYDDFLTHRFDDFALHMQVNAYAPITLIHALTEYALENRREAAIVNLSDQRTFRPSPGFFSYSVSKALLAETTKILSVTLAPNIRINSVSPGPVLPNIRQSAADFQKQAELTPLSRAVSADEIAEAITFLLRSPSVTGANIVIDSGQNLDWRTPSFLYAKE